MQLRIERGAEGEAQLPEHNHFMESLRYCIKIFARQTQVLFDNGIINIQPRGAPFEILLGGQ
ncbi:hypothetical protein A247_01075 [Pseudomonas syringae pv. actinidiae ICMP 19099]|uniref:Uncharacterized protein n=1 Tax=Pseudomonas syringae pv. actinidiae ICMP 19096 TaxID=1194405 RepID=A0A656JKZ4_PSESF|nr:hypothetical protein A247_01075 [Pseudomonas syringae pv. actinidiae ICMP 19099]EPN34215.1 hypothetical protein A245_42580 [Pseudomonas syringae pv. actinidiae ICMP 19096]EPN46320.1 hypothetical protein A242_00965 [Pseudomonas syringae pv. actinidiae ICMP 19095]